MIIGDGTWVDLEIHLGLVEHGLPETGGVSVSAGHGANEQKGQKWEQLIGFHIYLFIY